MPVGAAPLPVALVMAVTAPLLLWSAWRGDRWPMLLAAAATAWAGFGGYADGIVVAVGAVLVACAVLADGMGTLR